ncbi:hypothetical protein DWUX_1039 [Desulfovibrio diazotrophicus]|nr:hypothetical protein DWUX_1039 [Desulfovibrio diazotrophicus]
MPTREWPRLFLYHIKIIYFYFLLLLFSGHLVPHCNTNLAHTQAAARFFVTIKAQLRR